jgi:hypothetical protein
MNVGETQARLEAEMRRAVASRLAGNEGRARVCARRAAGFALAASLGGSGKTNAYRMLRQAESASGLSEAARQAAARLCTRVTESRSLPHPEDPLEDARLILEELGFRIGSQANGQWPAEG